MSQIVSVLHCFDNNFVVPAGVALHSLLKTGSPSFHYRIHILHSDISIGNQKRLHEGISRFSNAELIFLNMNDRFIELFANVRTKGHYSKEMFYKLLAPSMFPDLDKLLVSDVDVIFQGDVSRDFADFDPQSDYYLAGSPSLVKRGSWVDEGTKAYEGDFSSAEVQALRIGAGYYIANLLKMRQDGIEEQLLRFANENAHRLRQPEQDVLNLVCYPKIKLLPADSMVCTYCYDYYRTDADLESDLNYSAEEVRQALNHPVQLHYAGSIKPWNKPDCTKSEVWFATLSETPFLRDHLAVLAESVERLKMQKELFSFQLPLSKRRIVVNRVKAT
jgi:lipopolysaccharide biosynthesis glycosyltransferase